MLPIVAAIDFGRRRNREVVAFVAAVGLGELLLNNLIKVLVQRERPAVLHLMSAGGYSFPSGHTADRRRVLVGGRAGARAAIGRVPFAQRWRRVRR